MERRLKCKYCGEEFILGRGKRTDHCKKEDCLRKARNEANRKWYAKNKKIKPLEGSKFRIIEQKEEKKVVYSSTDRAINSANNEDFTEVIELARELGAIRYKIMEAYNKSTQEQSNLDKEKEMFIHKIENLAKKDEVLQDEIVELTTTYINRLQIRRFVKDKMSMLQHLLKGGETNPNAYVVQFIKNRDKRIYNPKIKEIKYNETIRR